jgi:hypothetical protein
VTCPTLGSRGIVPVGIRQSWSQGERVWGQQGMRALWGAATVKLLDAGLEDAQLLGVVSRLAGETPVKQVRWQRGHRQHSNSGSTTWWPAPAHRRHPQPARRPRAAAGHPRSTHPHLPRTPLATPMNTYRPSWCVDSDGDTGELPTLDQADSAEHAAEAGPENGSSGCRDVYAWVTQWALPTLGTAAQTGGRRWCARRHDRRETVLRLELAWQTWEPARHNPAVYAAWLLDTWDRMWAALTAPDGPFASCTAQRHPGQASSRPSRARGPGRSFPLDGHLVVRPFALQTTNEDSKVVSTNGSQI